LTKDELIDLGMRCWQGKEPFPTVAAVTLDHANHDEALVIQADALYMLLGDRDGIHDLNGDGHGAERRTALRAMLWDNTTPLASELLIALTNHRRTDADDESADFGLHPKVAAAVKGWDYTNA
jgi:hypothetical protein